MTPWHSHDGAWAGDGSGWRLLLTTRLLLAAGAWLALLVAPALVLIAGAQGAHLQRGVAGIAVGLGVVALLATVVLGMAIGRTRLRLLLPVAGVGTAVLLGCYVAAYLASPPDPGQGVDNAAGAGAVILGVPTFAVLVLLLWFGALSRRSR